MSRGGGAKRHRQTRYGLCPCKTQIFSITTCCFPESLALQITALEPPPKWVSVPSSVSGGNQWILGTTVGYAGSTEWEDCIAKRHPRI